MPWLPWYPGFTPWSGRGGYAPPEKIYWINWIMQNKLWPAASWDLSYEGGCTDMIQKDVSKNDKWSQSILIIFCLCGFQICFIVTLIVHCTDKNILFLLWHLYTYTVIHWFIIVMNESKVDWKSQSVKTSVFLNFSVLSRSPLYSAKLVSLAPFLKTSCCQPIIPSLLTLSILPVSKPSILNTNLTPHSIIASTCLQSDLLFPGGFMTI